MLATLFSAALSGLDGRVIRVEVDVANGLPGLTIVGLPDTALSEARERVRSAIRSMLSKGSVLIAGGFQTRRPRADRVDPGVEPGC